MISLFVRLCKSLGINIMFILLLLNEGEWCELVEHGRQRDYKGDMGFEAKYSSWFCVDFVETAFRMIEMLLTCDEGMNAPNMQVLFIFLGGCSYSFHCSVDFLEKYRYLHRHRFMIRE